MPAAQIVPVSINHSLTLDYLVHTANHWDIPTPQLNSNRELKTELIQLLKSSLEGTLNNAYVKAYLYKVRGEVFLIPASKPTLSVANIVGIKSAVSKLRNGLLPIKTINLPGSTTSDTTVAENIASFHTDHDRYKPLFKMSDSSEITSATGDGAIDIDELVKIEINSNSTTPNTNGANMKLTVDLPAYIEGETHSKNWIRRCLFTFSLNRISDESIMVAKMLSALPSGLAKAVSEALIESDDQTKTVNTFTGLLVKLTHRSSADINALLERLQLDPSTGFRALWYKILDVTEQVLDGVEDTSVLEITATSTFRKKMPSSIRNIILFQMSELKGIELADFASRIEKSTQVQSNNLRYKPKSSYKPANKSGPFNNQQRSPVNQTFQPRHQNTYRPNFRPQHNGQLNNGPQKSACFYCHNIGHRFHECRKLARAKAEGTAPRNWAPRNTTANTANTARRHTPSFGKY